MTGISVATVFGDEIEKQWRSIAPREAVFQLRLMAEQIMTLEKAINTQQRMIEKLMKFAILEGNALKELEALKKRFDRLDSSPTTEDVEKEN